MKEHRKQVLHELHNKRDSFAQREEKTYDINFRNANILNNYLKKQEVKSVKTARSS